MELISLCLFYEHMPTHQNSFILMIGAYVRILGTPKSQVSKTGSSVAWQKWPFLVHFPKISWLGTLVKRLVWQIGTANQHPLLVVEEAMAKYYNHAR